jgi:hypothetical protein
MTGRTRATAAPRVRSMLALAAIPPAAMPAGAATLAELAVAIDL